MMRKLFAVSCLTGIAVAGIAAPAYAGQGNPSGTGQPDQSCQTVEGTGPGSIPGGGSPGNAGSSPGSVFNEPNVNTVNGGQGGFAYNNIARQGAGTNAQYDVACFHTSQAGVATPPPTTGPAPGPMLHMPQSGKKK